MKTKLKNKFKEVYPKGARLLAIQLNGFSHKVFFDSGRKSSAVECHEYSGCMPEGNWNKCAVDLFDGIGHSQYQNNALELLYIAPSNR